MLKFITLFFLFLNTLNASLTLTNDINKYEDFTIEYLYDENSTLTIKEVSNKDFEKQIPSQFTEGYKYGNAWFKLKIKNDSDNKNFVLYFTESIWAVIDLYSYKNGEWEVQKNGLEIPLEQRSIKNNFPSFNLQIEPGNTATYFIKGNTIASQLGEFQVFTQDEYFNPSRFTISEAYIIYAFILLSFVLLNFYNLIMTKESIYAYYVVYVLVNVVFSTMHSGVYMYFGFENWNAGLHTVGQLTLLTLLLFSIEFLELKRTYPFMRKVFLILTFIAFIFSILLSQSIPYSTFISNLFFCATLITIVSVAFIVLRRGFDGAKYYLLALMIYLPLMAMMAMNFNAILPNTDITRYSFLLGAFIEIFLFTLILTNRYKKVNQEKIKVQNALLKEQKSHEIRLVSEINKKTEHLTVANSELQIKTKELEIAKQQLTKDAITDVLSGLYNRRYFFEASHKAYYNAIKNSEKLSIIILDIDDFKQINDTYGHLSGDKVIKIISNIIKNTSRENDIVARYGGEEFTLLLPNSDLQESLSLAEKIRINIQNEDIKLDNNNIINVSASIGVTELNHEDDSGIEEAIVRCDKALYKAKDEGKNKVCSI